MATQFNEMRIDPEFEQKIPPITQEEFCTLEENILADGEILNAIIVWEGIIVDGHNRFKILLKHPEIPYHIHEKAFDNRFDAFAWICKNQLGRRNLTLEQRKYLIGKQYEAEKAAHGGDRKSETKSSSQSGNLNGEKTCERIAREHNIGKNTVIRAEVFANAVDAADDVSPGIRQNILSGRIKPTEKEVQEIISAEPIERSELVEQLCLPKTVRRGQNQCIQTEGMTVDDRDVNPRQPEHNVSRKLIQEISEGMVHSEGVAGATEGSMIYEMNDALEDMIFRWNLCRETYPVHVRSRTGKAKIKQLADQGIDYFRRIKKGGLWNEQQSKV
ncbi:MAG: hypothetical protein Q4C63_02565 [Eubacteriales bacterium]|nr:hypothetical protein [Eubacteriales bacterium]